MWGAVRQLWRQPTFTIAVVTSLTLGIGANAAIFALLNALLLRPIGAADPGSLICLSAIDDTGVDRGLSPALIDGLRLDETLAGACAVLTPLSAVEANGTIAPRPAHAVSGRCLEMLGARPAMGRLLSPADAEPGADPVVVISHRMWQRDFGGRPDAVGETITIDGRPSTVIGVTEPAFTGVLVGFEPEVIYPLTRLEERATSTRPDAVVPAQVIARLRPGLHPLQAAERIGTRWAQALRASVPPGASPEARSDYLRRRLEVTSAETGLDFSLRRRFTNPLIVLMCLSGVVLLTACVNAANLLLARSLEKRRQTALRMTLGATRWRVVRHELGESLVLLGLGVAGGCFSGYLGARGVVALLSATYSGLQLDVAPDGRVLLFASAAAAVVLVAFGGVPAWRAATIDASRAMDGDGRVSSRRGWASGALVASQIALAFTLLVGAAFCAQSVADLRGDRAGFDPRAIISAQLMPRPTPGERRAPDHAYYRSLMARVAELAGTNAVALSSRAPLFGAPEIALVTGLGGALPPRRAEVATVTRQFGRLLGAPLVAGRWLDDRDGPDRPGAAMVSESMAMALFGTRDVVGRRLRVGAGADAPSLEVVGVVRDAVVGPVRDRNVHVVYTSFWQAKPGASAVLLVDANAHANLVASRVMTEIQKLGRQYPARLRTLSAERDTSLLQEYLLAALASAFAAVGLALAVVGVYGVLSVAVARRRREIGIRLALGAVGRDIVRAVLGWVLALIGAGLAIGLPLVWMAARSMAALFGPDGGSLVVPTFVAAGVITLAAGAAAWRPVWRATSVHPADSLRAL
jgi:putative ABC transport system permease protein